MKLFNGKRQLQQELEQARQQLADLRAEVDAAESKGRTFEELIDVLGVKSHSGSVVTHKSALQVAAVFACVSLISGAIASIPLKVYQRKANGIREESDNHPLLLKLCLEPSPMVTALVFWETLITDMLLDGNAYAVIDRDLNGRVRRLIYVNPASVNVRLVEGDLSYIVAISPDREQLPRATKNDIAFVGFYPSDILHFPGVGWNGKTGMSVIKSAALSSVGNALSADQFTGLYFKQGISSPGYLKFPQKLTKEQFEMMREYWKSHVVGADQAHLPPIITEGGEFMPMKIKADDVQLLETRKFQVLDIARIFGVPPHMIGAQETTTSWGTGIEQQSIGFVRYTLRPHLTRIEQELNRKLFRNHQYFSEFDVNALLRGDIKARNEAHQIALGGNQNPGWKTVNEIRREENLKPIINGDTLYQPLTGETSENVQTDEPDSEESENLRNPGTIQ